MGRRSRAGERSTSWERTIGPGIGAIRDPRLLADLADRSVPLEVCPTSNLKIRVCDRLSLHPFPHLDRMGLMVTVNSDDPHLFGTTLTDEYPLPATEFGYRPLRPLPHRPQRLRLRLCDTELRSSLLEEFDSPDSE